MRAPFAAVLFWKPRIHADRVEADDFVLEDVLGSNWIGAGGSLSDTFQEYAVKLWRRQ